MSTARQQLLDLILDVSFERRKITLTSGKQSDFYLDLRTTLMRPRGIALAGALLLDRLERGPAVQSVGGMVVAAVPVVSASCRAASPTASRVASDLESTGLSWLLS